MKRIPLGPKLVFLGVFGGGILWIVLCEFRFWYLINEVYNGGGPGEPIWVIDPLFTILAAIPGMTLAFIGLIFSIQPNPENSKEAKPETGYQKMNMFYIGEICILVATVVSFIGFLGISSLAVEVVRASAIIMGVIVITCIIQMLSFVLSRTISRLDLVRISRNTAILLTVELVILPSIVLALGLDSWNFFRSTTFVTTSSGFLGLLFLAPGFLNLQSSHFEECVSNSLSC